MFQIINFDKPCKSFTETNSDKVYIAERNGEFKMLVRCEKLYKWFILDPQKWIQIDTNSKLGTKLKHAILNALNETFNVYECENFLEVHSTLEQLNFFPQKEDEME